MAALVEISAIKPFLKAESTGTENDALITACEENAEAIISNRVSGIFGTYTSADLPADLKTAIIKVAIAEFIASTNNVNFVPEGGYMVDRASRYRKEAFEIVDKYYTPKVA